MLARLPFALNVHCSSSTATLRALYSALPKLIILSSYANLNCDVLNLVHYHYLTLLLLCKSQRENSPLCTTTFFYQLARDHFNVVGLLRSANDWSEIGLHVSTTLKKAQHC